MVSRPLDDGDFRQRKQALQFRQVVFPVDRPVRVSLNRQQRPVAGFAGLKTLQPPIQGAYPLHRYVPLLQGVAAQRPQEAHVVGVVREAPRHAPHEPVQQQMGEAHPPPRGGPYQRRQQHHPLQRGAAPRLQKVHDRGGAGALRDHVPGRPRFAALGEDVRDGPAVVGEVVDRDGLAGGETVSGQVEGGHVVAVREAEADQMAVQADMVEIAVHQQQVPVAALVPPDLRRQSVIPRPDGADTVPYFGKLPRKVQAVELEIARLVAGKPARLRGERRQGGRYSPQRTEKLRLSRFVQYQAGLTTCLSSPDV